MFEPSPIEKEIARKVHELPNEDIAELLSLAGADPSDTRARNWLRECYKSALLANHSGVSQRPSADEYRLPLEGIRKAADKLHDAIKKLDRGAHPHAANVMRLYFDAAPPIATHYDDAQIGVVATLERLSAAATDAINNVPYSRPGAKRTVEREIAEYALDYYRCISPNKPSMTPTGRFAKFVRKLCELATGKKCEGLDRIIPSVIRNSRKAID